MAESENASMERDEDAVLYPRLDQPNAQTQVEKLPSCDNSMLALGQLSNRVSRARLW